MSWWNPTPYDKFKAAMKACDESFAAIEGVQGDEIISIQEGNIEFVLFGTEQARDIEYAKRHGTHCPGYAFIWASATRDALVKAEVWIPFKRLPSGEIILHPWACQHEVHHLIDLLLRLDDRADDMGDPDNLVKEYVWEIG